MAKAKADKKSATSLMDKLRKSNTLENAEVLKNSKFFVNEFHSTHIPALDIALSARVKDGGFSRGSLVIAGDSKTFKSMFMLLCARAFLKKHEDGIFIFYDNEFGTTPKNFEALGIPTDRVFHKPLNNIEELKQDMAQTLDDLDESDNVIFGIDSLGSIASLKEVEDALKGDTKVDMTRAKQLASFWRIVNPYLNNKNIPLIAIGQTYETQEMHSKTVVKGGKAMEYFPNTIWTITKLKYQASTSEMKNSDTKHLGSNFRITVAKGRLVKERSEFTIQVLFKGGIDRYSALLDLALMTGHVKGSGWYESKFADKKFRKLELVNNKDFWQPIIDDPDFQKAVYDRFALASLEGIDDSGVPDELELEDV